ncbi:PucR family transcriptional regulator [Gordonia terrae]|uniref:PucR family transcriptional regulator n=2 Tax=Gordonia terrae TaxID=2055 RepID=A0AAD0NVR7_9ACTN|nr:helix-turn-helix domain-containing protein [Gordonia terrae]VTR09043.1 transcriptional regulator [Clostridioides difficile]ANY21747.1 PucR family transcriptional regulator [Gordonia terrae]AWO82477.1 PucR family transcriptional regulator [Gordonia terrae]VTS20227.1 Sugar diacid utilization regulator [Gordonia terrae]GAB44917.1 putative CdaR family transcriptional regulator [Gordonia terrae NBRC 100016]
MTASRSSRALWTAGDAARDRLAGVPAAAGSELLEQAAVIAKTLQENVSDIVSELSAMMAREIDQLDTDPKLVELLEASVHGNVSTIIHVLANDIPIEHLQPTTAAVEYALRLAQRDVPSNSLVRAYHLGQNSVMRQCYRLVEDLDLDAGQSMALTRHISDVLSGYIDWISLYVFEAYEDERRRWLGVEGNVQSAAIHSFLDSAEPDERAFESETGYPLDRRHVALILWSSDDEPRELVTLTHAARELGTRLGGGAPPIVTAIDRSTVWAWIPLVGRDITDDSSVVTVRSTVPAGIRVAVGLPASGARGFRRTHEQARAAYSVATMPGGTADRVIGFGDRGVAVVSLLARDLESTRAWVREVLGGLAEDTSTANMLRETLSVYFATKESHLHTAERLNLHRNTVKYRVGKALAEVPSDRDRLDLALALTVCEFLGPVMFTR